MLNMSRPRIDRHFFVIAAVYLLTNMSTGLVSPYLNLHLARIGLTGAAIGLIGAASPLGGIIGPPVVASLSDARGQVGPVVAVAMVVAALMISIVVWVSNPWIIAALIFGFGVSMMSVAPLMDTTALKYLGERRNLYGRLRAWGSLGFMLAASSGGILAARFEIRHLLMFSVILMAGAALFARHLPGSDPAAKTETGMVKGLKGLSRANFNPNFLRFAIIVVFGQMAETTQYTFFAIHIDRLGLESTIIGLAWAVAVTSEVLLLWNMERLLAWLGVRTVVIVGFCGAALRWLLTSFTTDPTALIAIQVLHGLTFGAVYAGTVQFVHLAVPTRSQASGQALLAGGRAAFAGVIATPIIGFLSDIWSIPTLYIGSMLISLTAALCIAFLVKDPTDGAGSTEEPAEITA